MVVTANIDPNTDPIGHPAHHDPPREDPFERRLRARSEAGRLCCRGCSRTVLFKRGLERVAHLAHAEHTPGCPYNQSNTKEHVAATYAFYRWLGAKLNGREEASSWRVDLEERLDGADLHRPLDLRLRPSVGGAGCGFLLVSRRFGGAERSAWSELEGLAVERLHVFGVGRRFELTSREPTADSDARLPDSGAEVRLRLRPQERWAVGRSDHAAARFCLPRIAAGEPDTSRVGGQVRFLVPTCCGTLPSGSPEAWQVVTFFMARSTAAVEQPAVMLRHPLTEMKLRLRDGLLVHPEEHERLASWRRRVLEDEEALRRRRAALLKPAPERSQQMPPAHAEVPGGGGPSCEADEIRGLLRELGDRRGGYIDLLRKQLAEIVLDVASDGRVTCTGCGERTREPAVWDHEITAAVCQRCVADGRRP